MDLQIESYFVAAHDGFTSAAVAAAIAGIFVFAIVAHIISTIQGRLNLA